MALTLAQLVDRLGPSVVLAHQGSLDVEVTDMIVTDPQFPVRPTSGALVVALGFRTGTNEWAGLVAEAAETGAAAIVLKGRQVAGAGSGPSVVLVDPDADWGQLVALIRAALEVTGVAEHPEDSLFGLAEAIASLCGGPVLLHDPAWQLLAYSGGQPMDAVRSESILARRAPARALAGLRAVGALDALARGEVVELEDGKVDGLSHRYAVAVRAGSEVLATIWLQPDRDLPGAETEQRLRRAADTAALTLLRHLAGGPAGADTADSAFGSLLNGGRTERLVAQRLGVELDTGFVLCGLRPTADDAPDRIATARRLLTSARSHCDAFRVRAQVAAGVDTVYLVFAAAHDEERQRVVRIIADIHRRVQATAPHRAMVSSTYRALSETSSVRRDVDELLALAERRGWSVLTDGEAVQASWRLEQFREVALSHPALLAGPIVRLVDHDRAHGTELVATLRTYFESVGDTRTTAKALGLHVNTVRYRVGRAQEVGGFDLAMPDDRLLVELQIRLLSGN